MTRGIRLTRFSFLVVLIIFAGCSTSQKHGNYRIDLVKDGMFNLVCFPHLELFYIGESSGETKFLGSCGAPGIVTSDFKMPVEPSCYALSKDNTSVVYYHNSMQCGGGSKSEEKPSGVYLHTKNGEDKLIYSNKYVSQIWSRDPLPENSIRVSWKSNSPSKNGALCMQTIVLDANGIETVEGKHDPKNNTICQLYE